MPKAAEPILIAGLEVIGLAMILTFLGSDSTAVNMTIIGIAIACIAVLHYARPLRLYLDGAFERNWRTGYVVEIGRAHV